MKGNGTGSTLRRRRRDLANEPTHADIALRAYQLFEDRGREHGDDLKDWLKAERELRDQPVVGVPPFDALVARVLQPRFA